VSDVARNAVARTAKLASLPLGAAGRATIGIGRRIGGRPAEMVTTEVQERTAEQVFRVLGELKGGAMKFGQALSVFEAAMPEQFAGAYRAALTRLQDSAPTMPAATVHSVLARDLGADWRGRFQSLDDEPVAAASIGQVHRGVWQDGREVAVKAQYPGAGKALRSDLGQIGRLSRLIAPVMPGIDVRALADELSERMVEELDYRLEARAQAAFAEAYANEPDIAVPDVVHATEHVLVTTWMPGRPLSSIIAPSSANQDDERELRNTIGDQYVRFLFSGPARTGMLHADPHPGNYRLLDDGRMGVLDFGAVSRFPDGFPPSIGRLMGAALVGDQDTVLAGLRDEGFIRPGTDVSAEAVYDYLAPFLEPAAGDRFHFTRDWLQQQFARVSDPRSPGYSLSLKINLPPAYLLLHRVWMGGIGVLAQLSAEVPVRSTLEQWLPGFATHEV